MIDNIDDILTKYWAGESAVEEEDQLHAYFQSDNIKPEHQEYTPLFSFFNDQKAIAFEGELDLEFTKTVERELPASVEKKTKTRSLFPKLIAVAASLALMVMFTNNFKQAPKDSFANTEVLTEEQAYEITKEALAFLGNKYEKGSDPMKHLKQLEKTNIFKF